MNIITFYAVSHLFVHNMVIDITFAKTTAQSDIDRQFCSLEVELTIQNFQLNRSVHQAYFIEFDGLSIELVMKYNQLKKFLWARFRKIENRISSQPLILVCTIVCASVRIACMYRQTHANTTHQMWSVFQVNHIWKNTSTGKDL